MKSKFVLLLVSLLFIQDRLIAQQLTTPNDSVFFEKTLNAFARGNNTRRYRFIKKYSQQNKLQNLSIKTQAIDWAGLYRNIIVEKKGETDSIVYIVCHYDKIDGNLLAIPNLLLNGSLDILLSNIYFSKGAYDNGTGVLTLLNLMTWINDKPTHYTYRFLFAGMEEFGLRGSRRHVSSLSRAEWNKCVYAINIDMICKKGTKGITASTVSHPWLMTIARNVCNNNHLPLTEAKIPKGAFSDYRSFMGQSFGRDFGFSLLTNSVGGFIPQRSYFTKRKKGIPVINFSDDFKPTAADYLSAFSPVSFSQMHSYKDKKKVVSMNNLSTYSIFLKEFISFIDRGEKSI